ncbi:hypothetical protein DFH08DRAFT_1081442, partial [Mycena albidolilacea]
HSILSASAPLPYWDEHCLCRRHVEPRQRSQAEAPSLFGCLFPNLCDTLPPARPPARHAPLHKPRHDEHQRSPCPPLRGGPLTRGGGTPTHSAPWSSRPPTTCRPRSPRRCSRLVTRIVTRDHRRRLDNRRCAREFRPDLPYIALHAFLADWLHPALAHRASTAWRSCGPIFSGFSYGDVSCVFSYRFAPASFLPFRSLSPLRIRSSSPFCPL